MARILMSAAGYETASYYALFHAQRLANILSSQGHIITFLENPSAVEVYSELNAEIYEYYYHTGHGCESITTTVYGEDLFWVPGFCSVEHAHDDTFLHELPYMDFVFFMSCLCGQSLIPKIAEEGGRAASYVEEFSWVAVPPYAPGGMADIYSTWFFNPGNQYFLSKVNGATFEQAHTETMLEFEESIQHWRYSSDSLATLCITLLIKDRNALLVQTADTRIGGLQIPSSNIVPLLLLGGVAIGGIYLLKKVK